MTEKPDGVFLIESNRVEQQDYLSCWSWVQEGGNVDWRLVGLGNGWSEYDTVKVSSASLLNGGGVMLALVLQEWQLFLYPDAHRCVERLHDSIITNNHASPLAWVPGGAEGH